VREVRDAGVGRDQLAVEHEPWGKRLEFGQ
jgi:hypothetical protein